MFFSSSESRHDTSLFVTRLSSKFGPLFSDGIPSRFRQSCRHLRGHPPIAKGRDPPTGLLLGHNVRRQTGARSLARPTFTPTRIVWLESSERPAHATRIQPSCQQLWPTSSTADEFAAHATEVFGRAQQQCIWSSGGRRWKRYWREQQWRHLWTRQPFASEHASECTVQSATA